MSTLTELLSGMHTKLGFQVVEQEQTANRIYLLGRVVGQTPHNLSAFGRHLSFASEKTNWSIDFSLAYAIRKGVYAKGWRLIFTADDTTAIIDQLNALLRSSPSAQPQQIDEFPLSGYSSSRDGQNTKGRGASVAGQAIIGRR